MPDSNPRDILHDLAIATALRIVSIARDNDLQSITSTDHVDVPVHDASTDEDGAVKWHLTITVWNDPDQLVRIDGHPEEAHHPIAHLFGLTTGSDGRFQWTAPIAWIEAAAQTPAAPEA